MRVGFCGAHRTGKTELAGAVAAALGVNFIETTTSAVFASAGIAPSAVKDFGERMRIQPKVLDSAEALWRGETIYVTDRTPIDMLAYTLADIQGGTRADPEAVAAYAERCFKSANRHFDLLVLVQPGITIVDAPGKAAPNPAYIEHFNSLAMGLLSDERLQVPHKVLRRSITRLVDRQVAVEAFVKAAGI
jgi:hypothetical protein